MPERIFMRKMSEELRASRNVERRYCIVPASSFVGWLSRSPQGVAIRPSELADQVPGRPRRQVLVDPEVDVRPDELHRPVAEDKVGATRVLAAEVVDVVRRAVGSVVA